MLNVLTRIIHEPAPPEWLGHSSLTAKMKFSHFHVFQHYVRLKISFSAKIFSTLTNDRGAFRDKTSVGVLSTYANRVLKLVLFSIW